MKNIKFYNDGHHGDIFFSRPFIKQIITNNLHKFTSFEFYSKCHRDLTLDIPNLNVKQFCDDPILSNLLQTNNIVDKDFFEIDNSIYINTWAARQHCKYVQKDFSKFSFEGFYDSFLNTVKNYELEYPEKKSNLFQNNFDYSFYENSRFEKIKNLMKEFQNKTKILICNNDFFAGQSQHYNYENLLNNNNLKKDCVIFLTNYSDLIDKKDNLFFVSDIIDGEKFHSNIKNWHIKNKSDLIEISFISNFCDIIIGRDSGPFEITKNYNNAMNDNKVFISLCIHNTNHCWYDDNLCNYYRFNNVGEYDNIIKKFIVEQ